MAARIFKIVAWAVGMAVAVYLIIDGKSGSQRAIEHALVGAGIGLILGILFARNLKPNSR
jgi:hypothetical protein